MSQRTDDLYDLSVSDVCCSAFEVSKNKQVKQKKRLGSEIRIPSPALPLVEHWANYLTSLLLTYEMVLQ